MIFRYSNEGTDFEEGTHYLLFGLLALLILMLPVNNIVSYLERHFYLPWHILVFLI